jgi:antitoxin component of MazEF toxin-antitoxin module
MRFKGKVIRIGNSLGVLIPNEKVRHDGIKEGDTLELQVDSRVNIGELFGSVRFTASTQELKNEVREGWNI